MEQKSDVKRVRLAKELADLNLHPGQEGIIRGSWREPTPAYEVEFESAGQPLRVLLLGQQLAFE